MGFSLRDFFGSQVDKVVSSVGDAIDKNVTSTEERLNAKKEVVEVFNTLEFDLEKLSAEDRASARDMQKAALGQEDKFSKRFAYYFASFWSVAGMVYIFAATYFTIINPKVADTVIGFLLGTIVATIINFFYGSSKGSADKQEILKQVLNNNKKAK
jgi:hypothetical protein